MTTIDVKDAAGATVAIEVPLTPGRKTAALSRPVVLSADDLAVLSSIDTRLTTLAGLVDGLEGLTTTLNTYVDGLETLIGTSNSNLTTLGGYVDTLETLTTAMSAKLPATLGTKAASASLPVTLSSDEAANTSAVANAPASTATITSVASAATSAQMLAANSARKQASFFNTDANAVLLKLGTTASASSFTVRIVQNGYFEMPKPIYTGRIDAIWEADGAGSLIITEY